MSTRDEDILDFDFFDEEEPASWEEPEEGRPGPPRGRGPRPPRQRMRPPGNLTPLLRLVALVGLAILVVVLLALWVEGCASEQKRDRYTEYMNEIGSVGTGSARLGEQLTQLLTTVGLKQENLDARLRSLVQQAETNIQRAQEIDTPGPLHPANEGAVEALQLRVIGLNGLRTTFQRTTNASDAAEVGQQLAAQMRRLEASDVVWADLFRLSAQTVLEDEGIGDLRVPTSVFVATDDLTTPSALAAVWQRIRGAATGGSPTGNRGNAIAYVRALPSGVTLSTDTETTIQATPRLTFEVGVEDSGDSQEVQVTVTLTIPKQPEPIVERRVIPIIDPGETKAVRMRVGDLVPLGEPLSIQVDVEPVVGETFTGNNSYEYPVIFTL